MEEVLEFIYHIFQKHPKVITDSRKIEDGCIFFALKGERFNGNKYAEDALKKGAAYAIIDEEEFDKGEQYILVNDVLETLQQLANLHRSKLLIPVIGITGSNGKTTTKELLATVLDSQYNCHFTKGNLNNHIGVPLTLLEIKENIEIAVIEMGANHIGEIEFLCNIAEPTHGLITNIGKAHLEGFGSLEGVKKAKSELYKFIEKQNGVAFINEDENYLTPLSKGISKRIFYKKSDAPDPLESPYETILYHSHPYIKVGFLNQQHSLIEIQSQLIGDYNFNNIMTAISVGRYFRVPDKKIKEAIEKYISINNRSQLVHKGTNTFILDAYNANPSSMKHAIENFVKIKAEKKVMILGDMLELGSYSFKEHQAVIEQANSFQFNEIILVGKEFAAIEKEGIKYFDNVNVLKDWFIKKAFENTHFLIKGSRGIRLEQLLKESD